MVPLSIRHDDVMPVCYSRPRIGSAYQIPAAIFPPAATVMVNPDLHAPCRDEWLVLLRENACIRHDGGLSVGYAGLSEKSDQEISCNHTSVSGEAFFRKIRRTPLFLKKTVTKSFYFLSIGYFQAASQSEHDQTGRFPSGWGASVAACHKACSITRGARVLLAAFSRSTSASCIRRSATSRNRMREGRLPHSMSSTSGTYHGLLATPPSATRPCRMTSPSISSPTATETTASASTFRSRILR